MPDPRVHTWSKLESDSPMPLIDRQRIVGAQAMISRVVLHKGFEIGTHQHENEQMAVVLSGKVTFGIGEKDTPGYREVTLVAGQVLELPGNVPHSARAHEETLILDVFAPPSEATGIDKQKKEPGA
ncbi:MAG: cupin domain-containing protein [Deltaproteobacteria bacterium]|nr:MAG: cupin domain-containing protein [Deltaproteobacteria bacterium]